MTTPKSKGGQHETLKQMNQRHAREFKQEIESSTGQPRPEQASETLLTPEEADLVVGAIPFQALPDGPTAPEQGKWAIDPYSSCEVVQLDVAPPYLADRIAQTYGDNKEQRARRAKQIVHEHNQHSTLIEQREQLLDLVKQLREFVCLSTWGKMVRRPLTREAEGLVARIDSVLTTIEQE